MTKKKPFKISSAAIAQALAGSNANKYQFPFKVPDLPPGVIPAGKKSGIAMDSASFQFAQSIYGQSRRFTGFPGYAYLSELATRAEFRAFASVLSSEITREWIQFHSSETASNKTKKKITEIEKRFEDLRIQQLIRAIAENDSYFGRGQIFIDINGQNRSLPLVIDPKTIKKGSLKGFKSIEPIWTSPTAYNALDPADPNFYKPSIWFMLGQEVHAQRLLTIITRPLPDILKPAFNFSGMSLSQLTEPYVDRWLRTVSGVNDLINNFSITVLKTKLETILQGDNGADAVKRAELFAAFRDNRNVFMCDKDTEEIENISTSLAGLSELQAQAEEHMGLPSRMPMIILTGISPSGLNASNEGEIKVWYDWIRSQQNAWYREPIEIISKIVQLDMYGEIDQDLTWDFVPLFQMTGKELSEIRNTDATAAATLIDRGVIDAEEERERLARDPESGYEGLDLTKIIKAPGSDFEDKESEEDE